MGFNLGSILGVAAPIVGSLIGGPAGGAIGSAVGGLFGQKQAAGQAQGMNWADYQKSLQAARPDQVNPFGSIKWSQDPKTGNWTQTGALNDQDQARLDAFRGIAADRMKYAGGLSSQFSSQPIDWNSLGFGALAKAAGVQGAGNTGQRPWASSPFTSVANEALNTRFDPMQAWGGSAQGGTGYQPGGVPGMNSFQQGATAGQAPSLMSALVQNQRRQIPQQPPLDQAM